MKKRKSSHQQHNSEPIKTPRTKTDRFDTHWRRDSGAWSFAVNEKEGKPNREINKSV